MLNTPFVRNDDLKRLRDEGYFVQIVGGLLVMRDVPYVDAQRRVRTGTLISSLALAGDETRSPDTHVVHFDGDIPCQADGSPIQQIVNQTGTFDLGHGLHAKLVFSSKPEGGYTDYYHKMTAYAGILCGPAAVLNPVATPRTFRTPDAEDDGVFNIFNYVETASDRAGIGAAAERLASDRIAIIGVGGTGSYILDLVAKTLVREIRLIDGDEFLQHSAFRAPGAPSIDELRQAPLKVHYYKAIYSQMHRGITAHPVALDSSNLELLDGITFAFLCIDVGEAKRVIVAKLEALGVPFIDVGMGIELDDGALGGILRVTASTPSMPDHVHHGRISFSGGGEEDLYSSNIQVADLNALNASLAVIKWKKIRGFYHDLEREHYCTYTIDGNLLLNDHPDMTLESDLK